MHVFYDKRYIYIYIYIYDNFGKSYVNKIKKKI